MTIPEQWRGRFSPKPVAGYPQTNVEPNRVIGPNPDGPAAQTAQRVEAERDGLQRALDEMGRRTRRLAG